MAGDPGGDPTAAAVPASAVDGPTPPAAARGLAARRLLRRLAVAVVGSAVVVVGLVLVPLPGPGWAVVFTGVALLGTEFSWAERLLHGVRRRLAPVTAAWERVPRVVRRVVGGAGHRGRGHVGRRLPGRGGSLSAVARVRAVARPRAAYRGARGARACPPVLT